MIKFLSLLQPTLATERGCSSNAKTQSIPCICSCRYNCILYLYVARQMFLVATQSHKKRRGNRNFLALSFLCSSHKKLKVRMCILTFFEKLSTIFVNLPPYPFFPQLYNLTKKKFWVNNLKKFDKHLLSFIIRQKLMDIEFYTSSFNFA